MPSGQEGEPMRYVKVDGQWHPILPGCRSCYLAGPMRGIDQFNFPAFEAAAYALRENGWTVFSPAEHDLDSGFDPTTNSLEGFSVEDALRWDVGVVSVVDAVVVLPGWEASSGFKVEASVAMALGLDLYEYEGTNREDECLLIELPHDQIEAGFAGPEHGTRAWKQQHSKEPLRAMVGLPDPPIGQRPTLSEDVSTVYTREVDQAESEAAYARIRGVDGPGSYSIINGEVRMHGPKFVSARFLDPERYDRIAGSNTPSEQGEHRVTDPTTGASKGQKSARTDLLPTDALLELAEHYGRGATKYADRNWEGGYKWSLSYAALMRHLLKWWTGEELDEEGFPHATAVAWHAIALLTFSLRKAGTDDRPL